MNKSAFVMLGSVLVLASVLTSCAAEDNSKESQESSQQFAPGDQKSGNQTAAETYANQAVITVAGVDVDGLNASATGYASQIIQDGLECEFTFTKGEMSVVRTTSSTADRSGSSCGAVSVPIGELERGTWEVKLLITGAEREIAPDVLTMEVP